MPAGASAPIEVFVSYSHEDDSLRQKLGAHLSLLKRQNVIDEWHDRLIDAGEAWADRIDQRLESAAIILLLVSADFIASDYCYEREMKRALERDDAGTARVIPVILREVDNWQAAPFGRLQALPDRGKPVSSWSNEDAALADVARGIRRVVESLQGWRPQEPLVSRTRSDAGPEVRAGPRQDAGPTVPAASLSHDEVDLLQRELHNLLEIDSQLLDDKEDTLAAAASLREWKKRVAAVVGPHIYGIEPDEDRRGKGMYGLLRNTMKKYRKYLEDVVSRN